MDIKKSGDIPLELTAEAQLLNSIKGFPVDRPTVIIPGGMMAGTLAALVTGDGLCHLDLSRRS